MTTWEPRRLRTWLAWPKRSRRFARKAQRRVVLRTGHANVSSLQACRLWRTITCGTLAVKPSNKPLHLTAARSLARRPSRLARCGLRPLRSRQTGARGQVSGNGVSPTETEGTEDGDLLRNGERNTREVGKVEVQPLL